MSSPKEKAFPGRKGTAEYANVVNNLARIKRMLQRVIRPHGTFSEADRIMAVICLDWSIETFIKTIAYVCDPRAYTGRRKDPSFWEVWEDVSKLITKEYGVAGELPMKAAVDKLREMRNRAQHQGIAPDEREVDDSRVTVRAFLSQVAKALWDIDIDQVSGVDLVKNKSVREDLKKSEWVMQKNTPDAYLQAAQDARRVLENVLRSIGSHVAGPMTVGDGLLSQTQEMRYIKCRLNLLQNAIVFSALGIDRYKYLECVRLTGSMVFTQLHPRGGFVRGTAQVSTYKEARRVIDYCVNAILDLEEKVGDLARPFGEGPENSVYDLIWMYNDEDFEQPMYDPKTGTYFFGSHDSSSDEPDPDCL